MFMRLLTGACINSDIVDDFCSFIVFSENQAFIIIGSIQIIP